MTPTEHTAKSASTPKTGHMLAAVCALCATSLLLISAPALAAPNYLSAGTFGGAGSGNGEFSEPTVQRFNAKGVYISQFTGAVTPAPTFPLIEEANVPDIGSKEATVAAKIDAGGSPTDYYVEYGPTSGYGASTPQASIGAPSGEAVSVRVRLAELQPEREYHFRFVATSPLGTTRGPDGMFRTLPVAVVGGGALPDKRVYERVSTSGNTEVYEPAVGASFLGDLMTTLPFQAASDGRAVAYGAEPAVSGGSGTIGDGEGNEWLAQRTSEGWQTADITPEGGPTAIFQGLSADLSFRVLRWNAPEGPVHPFTPDAPAECAWGLFASANYSDSYRTLLKAPGTSGPIGCGKPLFAGASADHSHLLFQSEAALVPGAQPAEEAPIEHSAGHPKEECVFSCNLYDSHNGALNLINVLPDESTVPNATLGGSSGTFNGPNLTNAISSDGSLIFWTDTQPGANMEHIYARQDGTTTIPVSPGPARFSGATPDGRFALYVEEGALWQFDTSSHTRELLAGEGFKGESPGVAGIAGLNSGEGGAAYVYFVATTVLAENERSNGEKAKAGENNLYLRHAGATSFIGTLSADDNELMALPEFTNKHYGDWQPDLSSRTSEATPDGRHLVFQSTRPLTGYNNLNPQGAAEVEVFVYAADTGRTVCASCSTTGASPQAPLEVGKLTLLHLSFNDLRQPRWISEDGSRVFFSSLQPVVPQDTNGVQDVYQWERTGGGGCSAASAGFSGEGCVSLLSSGQDPHASYFADASASGNDVFFTTKARLVAQDRGEQTDLYDARVDGGFDNSSLACTGTGCQGVPPASPSFATPPSATFNGGGNFPPSASGKQVPTKLTRAQLLAKALKACKRRAKSKRLACRKQAHKRYGPPSKSRSHKGGK